MLVSLHVKNLALIEEEEIFFEDGLNILTGETGAGKSVIIGSVNLALGAKADKELIRSGAEYALIELVFSLDEELKIKLRNQDIYPEEDVLVIQRRIMPSRSISKVCGESVSTKQLRDLAGILLDIHGQHEHQSLLSKKRHKEILDEYAKEKLSNKKKVLAEAYREWIKLRSERKEAETDEASREKEIAFLRFETEEITDAVLRAGEDEELELQYKKMANSRRIKEAAGMAWRLTGYEEGAGESIGRALKELKNVSAYDEGLLSQEAQLLDIDVLLNEFNRNMGQYIADLSYDEEDIAQVENRLNLINHLKTKYGENITDILAYKEKNEERLKRLEDYEAYRSTLQETYERSKETLLALCEEISKIRKQHAHALEKQLKQALLDLNFEEVQFEIQVKGGEETLSADGYDDVEFMISTNKGEKKKPLSQVASGGELSRIMLAFKTVIAQKDEIHTLIFDEIDTGISGRTAWKVAEKLGILGKNRQIICITHLAQIGAMADYHYLIQKKAEEKRTITTIKRLDETGSLHELARMLGSDAVTEAALDNAKELKELARNTKQY